MRFGLGSVHYVDDEILLFAKQLGATDIVIHTPTDLGSNGYYEYMPMLQLNQRVQEAGLRLYAIENVHQEWIREAMLGRPGRDKQIENYQKTIRNMGKAGIPVLGYNWVPNMVWRTSHTKPTRGNAKVTAFDYDLVEDAPLSYEREYTDEDMWVNYEYFIRAVAPVADEAGVRLALHPDDPPVHSLGGVARIYRNHDAFRRMLKIVHCESLALEFCQGTFSEMQENIYDAIREFASQGKIAYAHFRNVTGPVPKFEETFVDDGYVDMYKAMKTYKEAGFDGVFIDDHVPHMVGDTDYGHRGRAYAGGYIKALLDVVNRQG